MKSLLCSQFATITTLWYRTYGYKVKTVQVQHNSYTITNLSLQAHKIYSVNPMLESKRHMLTVAVYWVQNIYTHLYFDDLRT